MLAESGACYFLYLNDLTFFYLRCRFACDSLALRNHRLLRILSILLVPAKAALLRSPHNKKRPQWRSFYFNSCSRSWKYSGQKNSSTVIFRPSQSFLTVATVVVWFRPLIMLLSVDCVTPLRMLKRLIVILRSSHSAKMRRRTASPTVITTTPLSFHKEYRFPLEKINSFGLK